MPVPRSAVGEDGLVSGAAAQSRLAEVLRTLGTHKAALGGED